MMSNLNPYSVALFPTPTASDCHGGPAKIIGRKIKRQSGQVFSAKLRDLAKNGMLPTQSPVCRRDDGLPFDVDDLAIPYTRWRQESIKAYGNAIVPQVIYEEKEMYNV